MPSSQMAAMSQRRNQYAELPSAIAGAMRVKAVVVAPRAAVADRDPSNATQPGMVRNQPTEVDGRWSVDGPSSQPLQDIGTDLVAIATDRGAQVQGQLPAGHAVRLEQVDCALDDAARRAAPPRMQQPCRARRVREKYRNTVRDRDRHGSSAVECKVPVGVASAQPAFPAGSMRDHTVAVDLASCREPRPRSRELVPQSVPPPHDGA